LAYACANGTGIFRIEFFLRGRNSGLAGSPGGVGFLRPRLHGILSECRALGNLGFHFLPLSIAFRIRALNEVLNVRRDSAVGIFYPRTRAVSRILYGCGTTL